MNRLFQALRFFSIVIFFTTILSCSHKTNEIVSDKLEKPSKIEVLESTDSKSLTNILVENSQASIAERISLYHDYKTVNPSTNNLEEEMNMYGYSLLWEDKKEEALEIFKLLVSEYPNSSNTYDSLAETYQKMGNNDLALVNYKKSLALDPGNFNAEDQIEIINFPNKKKLEPQEKFKQVFSVKQYRDDLDQLGKTLVEVHPNALKFITREKFSDLINQKKELINEKTTYAEFSWHCNEIIANINCSHTNASRFYQENRMLPMELRFPLQTRLIEGRLFVTDPLNNKDKVAVKDEIVRINGTSVSDLIPEIYKHIQSQGYIKTTKRHAFNRWSTGMVAYALGFPKVYEVGLANKTEKVVLTPAEYANDPMKDESKVYCGDDLCLEFLDKEKKIAVMTISSFNYYEWNNFAVFQRFIDESMQEMIKNQTSQLIIDVRGNGGGSPESSIHLLKYLIHEPFTYYSKAEFDGKTAPIDGEKEQLPFKDGYKGKLFFLIDGLGNSTTGHFMSLVKDRNMGIIIGEELGSNQFCSAGQKRCRLSNTKFEYNSANNTHVTTATSLPDEVGIVPNHHVFQSIDDYVDAKDPVKQFAIDLIDKKMDWETASPYHSSYFLEVDNNTWRKELFRIPLSFAPDITLRGIEDARFPVGWEVKDSSTFWSYVFAWNVDHPQMVSADDLGSNIELYFDGLMRMDDNSPEKGKTKAQFKEISKSDGTVHYNGLIDTYDSFFDKTSMTFHVKAKQIYCDDIQRAIIIFRFSKQPLDGAAWDVLKEVDLPDDICNR